MSRTPYRGDHSANAQLVAEVVYAGDPLGEADQRAIDGEYARGMQGLTGLTYTGDKGGPPHTYGGALPYALQAFYGQAATTNILRARGPEMASMPVTGNAISEPIYRMLAQKLAAQ